MGLCLRRLVLQYPYRGGRFRPESVAAFNRNQWQPSTGIGGRFRPESVATFARNTHFTGTQMLSVLKRLVKRLRQAWPDTLLIFRGDSHFAYPEVMQWIEAKANLSYVTGLTSNAVLQPLAREVVEQAKRAYERDGGKIT